MKMNGGYAIPKASTYQNYVVKTAEVLIKDWFTPETLEMWVPEDYWATPTICSGLVEYMK